MCSKVKKMYSVKLHTLIGYFPARIFEILSIKEELHKKTNIPEARNMLDRNSDSCEAYIKILENIILIISQNYIVYL